jgi:hypothetical protein
MGEPITNDQIIPPDFRLLPVPMPPMLPNVVGVKGDSRFFGLNYEGSKPFWSDGRVGATFSYSAAYMPYVDHLAMAIHLLDICLGHDDEPPTHSLLIDRKNAVVYAVEYAEIYRFLRRQHPPRRPITPEEIEEANKQLADLERMSLDQLRENGMFEFMLGPKPEQQERCQGMIHWLDQYITEELIRSYVTAAEAGRIEAFYHLDRFRQRIEYSRSINTSSRLTN